MSRLLRFTVTAWAAFIGSTVAGYLYLLGVPQTSSRLLDGLVAWTIVALGATIGITAAASISGRFTAPGRPEPEPARELVTIGASTTQT